MNKILIVEDDSFTKEFYRLIFNRAGIEYVMEDDGDKLMTILYTEDIGLVILDVNLTATFLNGEKTDGIKICGLIKNDEKLKNIPVLLITSYNFYNNEYELVENSKADKYMTKPIVDYDKFVRSVKEMMDQKSDG